MKTNATVRKLEKIRERIGKERDALRDILDEVRTLEENSDRALVALDDCIDALSEYA